VKRLIHISDDVVLKRNEIIALLDVSTGQVLKQNVEFIKNARAHNRIIHASSKPRTMLLTGNRIYMLSISTKTAAKILRQP
jgi:hypothetical protein